ncbi:MAG TPA: hypothetical protein VFG76_03300, partial [Candidatus Polarisedimenticolia bacterium]|nr:hypothetical protein [Candidatus Polarisedimenticolia bacterium]
MRPTESPRVTTAAPAASEVFVLEGASRDELIERCRSLDGRLSAADTPSLSDLARAINSDMTGRHCRLAIVASTVEDLGLKLKHALKLLLTQE